MKLIEALTEFPDVSIFRRVNRPPDTNLADWDFGPVHLLVLPKTEDFYIVRAKNILPDGIIQECWLDLSLPERINDYAYFFDGKSLKVDYPHKFEGDIICAVPVDCSGDYELFYSKINPDIGIDILREGLALSHRKRYIAEDLGYILRDENRFREAAEIFQISVGETPSSYFIYGELAACYAEIGKTAEAEKYQDIFAREDRGWRKPSQ